MVAESSLEYDRRFSARGADPDDLDGASVTGRPTPLVVRSAPASRNDRKAVGRAQPPAVSNLAASFPLFFFGAGCVAAAVLVILEGDHSAIGRIPLWVPFVALGIIALVGGTLSVFAEPDEVDERAEARSRNSRSASRPVDTPEATDRYLRRSDATDGDGKSGPQRGPPTLPRPVASWNLPTESARTASSAPRAASSTDPAIPSVPDDPAELLKELDRIEAELHASRRPAGQLASTTPAPTPTSERTAAALQGPAVGESRPADVAPSSARGTSVSELESPKRVAHCVGCGSAIIHAKTPTKCQVCGEPLCSDCRDRSLAEGKPNLCPLCSLLDSVHARGPPTPSRLRT
jgi:hypothetical protein